MTAKHKPPHALTVHFADAERHLVDALAEAGVGNDGNEINSAELTISLSMAVANLRGMLRITHSAKTPPAARRPGELDRLPSRQRRGQVGQGASAPSGAARRGEAGCGAPGSGRGERAGGGHRRVRLGRRRAVKGGLVLVASAPGVAIFALFPCGERALPHGQ